MTLEHTVNGLLVSDLIGDQFISRLYVGYSEEEASQLFKQYIEDLSQ
tara:strand:- start:53 stop:193 length:141 start_codon:yes stop_codon:yes gene_type:complete